MNQKTKSLLKLLLIYLCFFSYTTVISYIFKLFGITNDIVLYFLSDFIFLGGIVYLYKDTLKHLYLTDRKKNPYSIAAINTYLFLKEEEIDKITTVLECIRYGLTKGETLAYLGGVVQ